MNMDHPSVQQAFHVLKDHLEAIERLQAQLKRWVGRLLGLGAGWHAVCMESAGVAVTVGSVLIAPGT